jgi:ATP-dependent DNA helicase 2 subunit 1
MDFDENEDLFIGEEEDQPSTSQSPQKEEILLLIDSSASMFQTNLPESPFSLVLKSTLSFLKNKILSSDSDSIGIVLFNTQVKKNHMDLDGLFILQDLSQPDAPRIKELQQLSQNVRSLWGHSEALLVDALWLCHDLLTQNKNPANRRILIFTDEDRPNRNRANDLQRTIQRARDLAQQDIVLELFPFNKLGQAFDFNSFYAQIIPIDEDQPQVDAIEKLEDLTTQMHIREYRKRKLGTVHFALCPNMSISMNYFCMLRESKKPTPSKLNKKDNKKLKSVTSWICEESGKQLWTHEVGNHYELGGSKVVFKKDEVSEIKNFDRPGLKLMGFKARERIKPYMNIRPSYFLHPDESIIKGSSQVVHSLIVSMKKLDKVAIVRFIARTGTLVKFGGLIPSEDPPGFFLIFLPYADDMRNPEILKANQETEQPGEELVASAAKMIGNIQLGEFDVKTYYNPVIQHFYTNLEALALQEPRPGAIIDSLQPDEEGLKRKAPFIENFWNAAFEGCNKRKPKQGKNFTEKDLKAMKVTDLKDLCDDLGLAKTGRKEDLVQRILNN